MGGRTGAFGSEWFFCHFSLGGTEEICIEPIIGIYDRQQYVELLSTSKMSNLLYSLDNSKVSFFSRGRVRHVIDW